MQDRSDLARRALACALLAVPALDPLAQTAYPARALFVLYGGVLAGKF